MSRRLHPHEPTAVCRHCGATFTRTRTTGNRQVYCSTQHRRAYFNHQKRRRVDGPAHARAIARLEARVWLASRSRLPRRAPTDVTPGHHEGHSTWVYRRVNSCPWCGGTNVVREDDGTWICNVCPWFWQGWRPRPRRRTA